MHVLLTGATGFVGSHAVGEFVNAGMRVRALVRSPARAGAIRQAGVELVSGSLADDNALQRACDGVDTIVHMAALTHARTAAEYHEVNAAGTARLLNAALAAAPRVRRFVYLSSLAAVGPARAGRAVTAADEPAPLTEYGRSKLAGERLCQAAADRMEVIILRASAVYGPRDTDVFHFFRLARLGIMPVPRGGARPLQMVHVSDLARALVLSAAATGVTGVYHIAEPRAYSWEEMGRLTGAAVGRSVLPLRVPEVLIRGLAAVSESGAALFGRSSIFNRDKARELLAPGWLCETEAARAALNFEAAVPLPDGLRSTALWYREQGWL